MGVARHGEGEGGTTIVEEEEEQTQPTASARPQATVFGERRRDAWDTLTD